MALEYNQLLSNGYKLHTTIYGRDVTVNSSTFRGLAEVWLLDTPSISRYNVVVAFGVEVRSGSFYGTMMSVVTNSGSSVGDTVSVNKGVIKGIYLIQLSTGYDQTLSVHTGFRIGYIAGSGTQYYSTFYTSASVPKPTYIISFNTGVDGVSVSNKTKTWGTTLTLPEDKPEKADHTFLGWSTEQDSLLVNYLPGSPFDINAATTLYAVHKSNELGNKGIRLKPESVNANVFMNEPTADKIKLYVDGTISAKTFEQVDSGENILKLYPTLGKIESARFAY